MHSPRSPRKPAKLFASPYHRHAFGSVELADVAWPKPPSDEARNRALLLSKSTPALPVPTLSTTMASLPRVPVPVGARAEPSWRPPPRGVRAHALEWQERHHALAADSIKSLEEASHRGTARDEAAFRGRLAELRQNRFHIAGDVRVGGANDDLLPSPSRAPRAPPPLDAAVEGVVADLAAEWGDAWSAHDAYVGVYAGARETEADRVRELLRNRLPLLMRVFDRVRCEPGAALSCADGGRLPADADAPRLSLGQWWALLLRLRVVRPGAMACTSSDDFTPAAAVPKEDPPH